MIKFLDDRALWPTITDLATKAKRSFVAVAYVGKGAAQRLNLKEGDVLLVAMGLKNLQAGQTNLYEIEKFVKRGVKVYSNGHLHAKAYLFDNQAIVCSANLSNSSSERLKESGVLTDDKKTAKEIKDFIKAQSRELVDEVFLTQAKNDFVPQDYGANKFGKRSTTSSPRYWLVGTETVFFDEAVINELTAANDKFEGLLISKRSYYIAEVELLTKDRIAKEASPRDYIICIHTADGAARVYPPRQILGVLNLHTYHQPFIKYAELKKDDSVSWRQFKSHLTKKGVKNITPTSCRELRGGTLDAVLGFFNHD